MVRSAVMATVAAAVLLMGAGAANATSRLECMSDGGVVLEGAQMCMGGTHTGEFVDW